MDTSRIDGRGRRSAAVNVRGRHFDLPFGSDRSRSGRRRWRLLLLLLVLRSLGLLLLGGLVSATADVNTTATTLGTSGTSRTEWWLPSTRTLGDHWIRRVKPAMIRILMVVASSWRVPSIM